MFLWFGFCLNLSICPTLQELYFYLVIRCFYLAESYNVATKYPEAYLLFKRAEQHAESASKNLAFDKVIYLNYIHEWIWHLFGLLILFRVQISWYKKLHMSSKMKLSIFWSASDVESPCRACSKGFLQVFNSFNSVVYLYFRCSWRKWSNWELKAEERPVLCMPGGWLKLPRLRILCRKELLQCNWRSN